MNTNSTGCWPGKAPGSFRQRRYRIDLNHAGQGRIGSLVAHRSEGGPGAEKCGRTRRQERALVEGQQRGLTSRAHYRLGAGKQLPRGAGDVGNPV
jgi:hypothetical protein